MSFFKKICCCGDKKGKIESTGYLNCSNGQCTVYRNSNRQFDLYISYSEDQKSTTDQLRDRLTKGFPNCEIKDRIVEDFGCGYQLINIDEQNGVVVYEQKVVTEDMDRFDINDFLDRLDKQLGM